MSDLKAYLAAEYMSGAKADLILSKTGGSSSTEKPKKKKRKVAPEASSSASGSRSVGGMVGVGIVDEDDALGGWNSTAERNQAEDEDEDVPVVANVPGGFKSTKANWKSLDPVTGLPIPSSSATNEGSERFDNRYDLSGRLPTDDPDSEAPRPKKKKGGLVSADELRLEEEERARQRAREERELLEERRRRAEDDQEQTIHRDRTGAIVDVKAEEEARRQQELEKQRKEREKKDWNKGIAQKREKEERAKREAEIVQSRTFGRSADDRTMNDEMRAEQRWEDPAAAFLTKKRSKGPQKPRYTGPMPPPNRFGIPPGYRWDGVDRGNGFEGRLFQKQNERARQELARNAWSMEDM